MEALLKLSLDFFKKYIKEYFILLIKPVLIGLLGFFVMFFMFINPFFAILGILVTIPCIFYSFWRGILITYSLNVAANYFYNKNVISLKECYEIAKQKEKDLALWITYVALFSIIGYVPAFVLCHIFAPVSLSSLFNFPYGTMSFLQSLLSFKVLLIYTINTLVLIPFFNYSQQAFYFKKPEEKFLDLFLNCYKNNGIKGYLIAFFVVLGGFILTSNSILIMAVLFFNVYIYGLNMFWWIKKENYS